MSNQIRDLPGDSSFGLDFNYAAWTPGTNVTLANVPWNSDYRDVVHFGTDGDLDHYIRNNAGPNITIGSMTYARVGVPVRINLPFNDVYNYNYLRVYNPAQPVPGGDVPRSFYYFINDVRYLAPNTTELIIQLDVWQTFSRSVKMGNCYIERGHVGIANEKAFDDNGRAYLTVPEGLDVGSEYVISREYSKRLASILEGPDGHGYGILMATTVLIHNGVDPGTMDEPKLYAATGSTFEGLPNGTSLYYFPNRVHYLGFIGNMSTKPWITQGIAMVQAVPKMSTSSGMTRITDSKWVGGNIEMWKLESSEVAPETINLRSNFRNDINLGRYHRLKKFLTFPYTLVELTTFTGSPVLLKPESINAANLEVVKVAHFAPPGARIAVFPKGYNAAIGDRGTWSGDALDIATGIFDMPTFSVVNDSYAAFIAANKNSIAYQHASADWSQQRAMMGANLAAQQADSSMQAQTQITDHGISANRRSMHLANEVGASRTALGMAGGLAGVVANPTPMGAAGAVAGMATRGIDYAIGVNERNQQLAISTDLSRSNLSSSLANQSFARDTNLAYAAQAASGDYANAIAAINAKVQDAKMIQPTTSGQIGGEAFNLAVREWGIYARVKTLQPAVMAAIGEFWLRYGYAVNRFGRMPSDYSVMSRFTYWKLRETYITSSTCPELFKQTLRGIFESGVTVWRNPKDIGNVDIADNEPLTGITL